MGHHKLFSRFHEERNDLKNLTSFGRRRFRCPYLFVRLNRGGKRKGCVPLLDVSDWAIVANYAGLAQVSFRRVSFSKTEPIRFARGGYYGP